MSDRTIEFYLAGRASCRGADERDLNRADINLDVGGAWLADFVEGGRKPRTFAARARACGRSVWIVTDVDVRTDSLGKLKVPAMGPPALTRRRWDCITSTD